MSDVDDLSVSEIGWATDLAHVQWLFSTGDWAATQCTQGMGWGFSRRLDYLHRVGLNLAPCPMALCHRVSAHQDVLKVAHFILFFVSLT